LIASARFVDSGGKFTTGVSDAGSTLFAGVNKDKNYPLIYT
jgi:hypothetical protein